MPIPVSSSETPLVFDTLPAVKVRFYHGSGTPGNIYSYGRMYVQGGSLCVSLTAFEKQPPPGSRLAIALCTEGGTLPLVAIAAKDTVQAAQAQPGSTLQTVLDGGMPLAAAPFAGVDEQGWYWGQSFILPAEVLAGAGIRLQNGKTFRAAIYKFRQDEDAFGASFEGAAPDSPFPAALFGSFTVTPYQ